MTWFRRHRCPPDIVLTIKIGGVIIMGPITGENLAYCVRYGYAGDGELDLLDPDGQISLPPACHPRVQVLARYSPRR